MTDNHSVELLAPAGAWDVLEAAVKAGADAIYLGGKKFNMRLHRTDANFDDSALLKAKSYTHSQGVRLYITVNNLLSERELPAMREYLSFLQELQPDGLIIQDLAILELAKDLRLTIPLHASVMMNTHSEAAIHTLKKCGITRVVVNRELSLDQIALLGKQTGMELEYFIHGDMCVAHSGQCLYSGIIFGQSSNRGRCLKPCRWPYTLISAETGMTADLPDLGPYKLALKDMCLYPYIPELIRSGVCSFKIEGRMRTADFVHRIVSIYRKAIDSYLQDPTGYSVNLTDWQTLKEYRSRDFSPCYAFGNPGHNAIGYTGKREPRFFSQAVKETTCDYSPDLPPCKPTGSKPLLAIKVSDLSSLTAACEQGADIVYIGGEAFKPNKPLQVADYYKACEIAASHKSELVINTPRITTNRELDELSHLLKSLSPLEPSVVSVSNLGSLQLVHKLLPNAKIVADYSFNIVNHLAIDWLSAHNVSRATVSLEAAFQEISELATLSKLPLEVVIHGPLEAMVMDHCVLAASLQSSPRSCCPQPCRTKHFALKDSANEQHLLMTDQYCRTHLLFGKDLCMLPYLPAFMSAGLKYLRIEGQYYSPEQAGFVTRTYRRELDNAAFNPQNYFFESSSLEDIRTVTKRAIGIGVFRYNRSR